MNEQTAHLQVNTISRTPHRICSFVLTSANASVSGSSGGDGITPHGIIPSVSNVEASFTRQNLAKNRKSNSFLSMPSNNSGRSLASSSANFSASTENTSNNSLKRSGSFSSITSANSLLSGSQMNHRQSQSQSQSYTYMAPIQRPAASLAMPVNPQMATKMKIAFQEYLLVPTSDGRILFYQVLDFYRAECVMQEYELNRNLFVRNESYHKNIANYKKMASKIQQEKEAVRPVISLGPFNAGEYRNKSLRNISDKIPSNPASIVDICICEVEHTKQTQPSLLGVIVVLVQEGDVHVFELYSIPNTLSGEKDTSEIKVDHIHSFHSGNIGATSLAVQRTLKRNTVVVNNTTLRNHQPELHIAVGYDGGTVTEFIIVERRHVFKWKGFLEGSVQALAYIHAPNQDEITRKESSPSPHGKDRMAYLLDEDLFLVMGTSLNIGNAMNSHSSEDIISSCLDVVNTSDVEKEWNSKFRGACSNKTEGTIDLLDLTIWPKNQVKGDEAIPISVSGQKKKEDCGLGCVKAVSSIIVFKDSKKAFSVLLSNGNVAKFTFGRNTTRRLAWGLEEKHDQIALPYPSCGMGMFSPNEKDEASSVAFCMRGGSVIIISSDLTSTLPANHRAVLYNLPYDADDIFDDSVRYIQGFSAGNIQARSWGYKPSVVYNRPIPCFFVSWPSGVIDCYTYDLPRVSRITNERIDKVYEDLSSNGALDYILHLLSLDLSHLRPESILGRVSDHYKLKKYSIKDLLDIMNEDNHDNQERGLIKLMIQKIIGGESIL